MIEYNLNIMILDNPLNMPWFIKEFILFYGGIEVLFDDMEGAFQAEQRRRLLPGEGNAQSFRKARQATNMLMMYLARDAGFWDNNNDDTESYPDVMILDNPLNMPWYIREYILWYGGIDVLFDDLEDGFQAELHRRVRRGENEELAFRKARQTTNRQIMDMAREAGFWHNSFDGSQRQMHDDQMPRQAMQTVIQESESSKHGLKTSASDEQLTPFCAQSLLAKAVPEYHGVPLVTALCNDNLAEDYKCIINACTAKLAFLRLKLNDEHYSGIVNANITMAKLMQGNGSDDCILLDDLVKGQYVMPVNEVMKCCTWNLVAIWRFVAVRIITGVDMKQQVTEYIQSSHKAMVSHTRLLKQNSDGFETIYLHLTRDIVVSMVRQLHVSAYHGIGLQSIHMVTPLCTTENAGTDLSLYYLPAHQSSYTMAVLRDEKKTACIAVNGIPPTEYMYSEHKAIKVSTNLPETDIKDNPVNIKYHILKNDTPRESAITGKNGKKKVKGFGSKIRRFFRSMFVCGRHRDVDS